MQKWKLSSTKENIATQISQELDIPKSIAHLLAQRGIHKSKEAHEFLNPTLSHLIDPDLLPNMEKATTRLLEAIEKEEPIIIYGDYDVDGITGSTILHTILNLLGAKVDCHISDRFKEGYGLSITRIRTLANKGMKVLVSVDMGCTAVEQAELCKKLSVDLIVTDHHTLPRGKLPDAYALIHPKTQQSKYPNKDICGAGVAYKLAWSLARTKEGTPKLSQPMREKMLEMLGLVGVGTIADVVALKGENRPLVHYGLGFLSKCKSPGIRALLETAGTKPKIDATQVGWRIAPLINSAGRMSDATDAFRLLSSQSSGEAAVFSSILSKTNADRRVIQQKITDAAIEQYNELYQKDSSFFGIVLAGEEWHEGVIGIVAARVVSKFKKPALVCSIISETEAKGSGRTISGVDLLAALEECKDLLISFGGHPAALGFKIKPKQIPAFRKRFYEVIQKQVEENPELLQITRNLDIPLDFEAVNEEFLNYLKRMEPFGNGNPEPYFLGKEVNLIGIPRLMGKEGTHVQFSAEQNGYSFRCVAFNLGHRIGELNKISHERIPFHLVYKPDFNEYKGQRKIELYIQDFSASLKTLLLEDLSVSCETSS